MEGTKFYFGAEHWAGLSKLIEEAGEVLQVAGKLMATDGEVAHYDGSDLKQRLTDEVADVLAAIQFMVENGSLNAVRINERALEKTRLFWGWHEEQLTRERAGATP